MKKIGILGAGLMGHGLAQMFAVQGCAVSVFDHSPAHLATLPERMRGNLQTLLLRGRISEAVLEASLERVTAASSLEAMCAGRQVIVEAVSEEMALKRRVFEAMETHVPPETILASNTSALSITDIARGLRHPERVVGTHFWNPPHIIPCVEVIKGAETSDAVFDATVRLLERVGKVPVKVLKDVPGFIGNRMQHALWREAIALVEQGVASAEDVDTVVKNAFGLRLAFLGPLETADLAGLELTHAIQRDLLPHLEAAAAPAALLAEKVAAGETGAGSGTGFHRWTAARLKATTEKRDGMLLDILDLLGA